MNRKLVLVCVLLAADRIIQDEDWAKQPCYVCGSKAGFDNKHGIDDWYRCRRCLTN